jgi:hypothetical protein
MAVYSAQLRNSEIDQNKLYIYLDKKAYKIYEEARLTISNFSGVDLIMLSSGINPELEIEKNLNKKWISAGKGAGKAASGSVVIKKGKTLVTEIMVPVCRNEDNKVAGKYRLKLLLYRKDNNNILSDNLRVSKPFKIVTSLKH